MIIFLIHVFWILAIVTLATWLVYGYLKIRWILSDWQLDRKQDKIDDLRRQAERMEARVKYVRSIINH